MNNWLHFLGTLQPLAADPVFISSWVGPINQWGAWKKTLTPYPMSRFLNFVQHYTLHGNSPHEKLTLQSMKSINKKTSLEKILTEVKFSLETEFNFSARGYPHPTPPPTELLPPKLCRLVFYQWIFLSQFSPKICVLMPARGMSERDVSYIPDVVPSNVGVTTFTC
jgi:hypothetical protein